MEMRVNIKNTCGAIVFIVGYCNIIIKPLLTTEIALVVAVQQFDGLLTAELALVVAVSSHKLHT